jgi:DNA-binding transcriptional regulator YhcF (GntR family)
MFIPNHKHFFVYTGTNMMTTYKNNQGQQTELVKNRIISYIRESNLSMGDKLPTQAELRQQLGVGSKTIQRAVSALQNSGIIELRGNKGVFLRQQGAEGFWGRQIGLVCMRLPTYMFGITLLQCLGLQLNDRGCQLVSFLRNDAPMEDRDALSLFPGLQRNIEQHCVDGLISTVPLDEEALELCRKHDMPVCYFGDHHEISHRVYLDPSFYADGVRELINLGSKRPGMVFNRQSKSEDFFRQAAEPLLGKSNWENYSFLCDIKMNQPIEVSAIWQEWDEVVRKIIAMPESARPDGLFIPDDFATSYIVGSLLNQKINLPRIVSLKNRQIPIGMPFNLAGYFQVDIMDIAGITVDLMLKRINKIPLNQAEICYKPAYIKL